MSHSPRVTVIIAHMPRLVMNQRTTIITAQNPKVMLLTDWLRVRTPIRLIHQACLSHKPLSLSKRRTLSPSQHMPHIQISVSLQPEMLLNSIPSKHRSHILQHESPTLNNIVRYLALI
jgi:hypothetical protein